MTPLAAGNLSCNPTCCWKISITTPFATGKNSLVAENLSCNPTCIEKNSVATLLATKKPSIATPFTTEKKHSYNPTCSWKLPVVPSLTNGKGSVAARTSQLQPHLQLKILSCNPTCNKKTQLQAYG